MRENSNHLKQPQSGRNLNLEADDFVLKKYPILRELPKHAHKPEYKTSYRLYRGIAPLCDGSIVFINYINIANKLFGAETQAMCTTAWFDKKIKLAPLEEENVLLLLSQRGAEGDIFRMADWATVPCLTAFLMLTLSWRI
jgi:hypothetical protein